MGVKQVETATAVGTITKTGNASVVITSQYVTGSPLTVAVAVLENDTAAQVAEKIRATLVYNSAVAAQFLVSGENADVVLTSHLERANDTTLNIAIANGTCTGLTAAPTSTNTLAGSGMTNTYGNVASFKVRYGVQGTDANRDAEVEAILQAVSRAIDEFTGRRFWTSGSDESKYFTASDHENVFLDDDVSSITSIKTDDDADGTYETTWTVADYKELPINRTANFTPTMWLKVKPNGTKTFPTHEGGVEITGKFGYCTLANVPDVIKEATYLQANRLWMRQSAPFGVVGAADMGQASVIAKLDPDVEMLLATYRRVV